MCKQVLEESPIVEVLRTNDLQAWPFRGVKSRFDFAVIPAQDVSKDKLKGYDPRILHSRATEAGSCKAKGPARERLLKFYRRLDQAAFLGLKPWLKLCSRVLDGKVLKILENKSYRKYYQNLLPPAWPAFLARA